MCDGHPADDSVFGSVVAVFWPPNLVIVIIFFVDEICHNICAFQDSVATSLLCCAAYMHDYVGFCSALTNMSYDIYHSFGIMLPVVS